MQTAVADALIDAVFLRDVIDATLGYLQRKIAESGSEEVRAALTDVHGFMIIDRLSK